MSVCNDMLLAVYSYNSVIIYYIVLGFSLLCVTCTHYAVSGRLSDKTPSSLD